MPAGQSPRSKAGVVVVEERIAPRERVALRENIPAHVPAPPETGRVRAAAFQVNYTGFTAQAQAAFQRAVDIWASQLNSSVPIVVDVTFTVQAPGLLGSAGPVTFQRDVANQPFANTWYPIAIANALAGVDLAPGQADITSTINSTQPWYFGLDGMAPANEYDFVSLILHELGHGLGFLGSGGAQGGMGMWGLQGAGDLPTPYDRFVANGLGQRFIDTTIFPNPSAALLTQITGGNLFFASPPLTSLAITAPARLYAPPQFEPGSTYSHLDEATYPPGHPDTLMTPQQAFMESAHAPGPIMLEIFRDTGWPVAAGAPPAPPPGDLPGAPTNFTAVAAGNTVNMSWGASAVMFEPANKAAATGYNLKARTSPGGPVIFNQPVGNVTQFSAAGPDGTFVLSVTGTNAVGEGPESNQQTVTLPGGGGPPACNVPPNTPVNVTNVVNGSTVTINWVDGGGCPATSYLLQATAGGVEVANTNVGNTLTFTAPGVPSGQYLATVSAVNAFGTSAPSAPTVINVP